MPPPTRSTSPPQLSVSDLSFPALFAVAVLPFCFIILCPPPNPDSPIFCQRYLPPPLHFSSEVLKPSSFAFQSPLSNGGVVQRSPLPLALFFWNFVSSWDWMELVLVFGVLDVFAGRA